MKRRKENLSKHQVKIWRFGDFPTPDLQSSRPSRIDGQVQGHEFFPVSDRVTNHTKTKPPQWLRLNDKSSGPRQDCSQVHGELTVTATQIMKS